MALVSLRNNEDALDVVQESMLQLAKRYGSKPENEWRPLFFRILQNKINDLHRRNNVRNRFKGWLPHFVDNETDQPDSDPFENVAAPEHFSPEKHQDSTQQLELLEAALHDLPRRQQEAFMLRCWEGFSTKETALAMKCSEGSVKTHYSRALHTLRDKINEDNLPTSERSQATSAINQSI